MGLFILINTFESDELFSLLLSSKDKKSPQEFVWEVLDCASSLSNCDACFLYKITPSKYINLEYINIKPLRLNVKGSSCDKFFSPTYIPDAKNKKIKRPEEICAITKDIINSSNIYNEPDIDASALKEFDLNHDYNSVSLLAFPIFDSNDYPLAVIQFINAKSASGKISNFSLAIQDKIIALCQLISFVLENRQQHDLCNKFLESLVLILSKTMMSKTPRLASVSRQIPIISQMIALALSSNSEGPFKNFEMNDKEWSCISLASWLHDCGKILAPDYLLNKKTKLESVNNRIHEIRQRFEILRRDAHIEYLQKRLNNVADKETLQAEFINKVKQLHEDFKFIGMCNNNSIELTEENIARLDIIASQKFTRHFDRSVGLSDYETADIDMQTTSEVEEEYLLQDRPEQINTALNTGELTNLKTKSGIINLNERNILQEYILSTSDILSDIPFSKDYSKTLEIINTYQDLLKKNNSNAISDNSKTTIMAKIIHLASVFAHLSSKETSSKPKKLSEIMKILQNLKNKNIIDADIYTIFVKNNIYTDYAKEHLDASQIDEINIEDIL